MIRIRYVVLGIIALLMLYVPAHAEREKLSCFPLNALSSENISISTTDGSDNQTLSFSAGSVDASSRGCFGRYYGNESAATGACQLATGNTSDSDIFLELAGTGSDLIVRDDSTTSIFQVKQNGQVELDVTGAGIVLRSPDGSDSLCTVSNGDVFSCTGL